MGGVTGQPHSAPPVVLGHRQPRPPGVGHEHFAVELRAEPVEQKLLGVDRVGVDPDAQRCVHRPGVEVVLRDQRPPLGSLDVPGGTEPFQQFTLGGGEMDQVHPPVGRRLAVLQVSPDQCRRELADPEFVHGQSARIDVIQADAQALADNTAGAVTTGEKPCADPAGLTGCGGPDDGIDAVLVLGERVQRPAEPDVDVLCPLFQQPFEGGFDHHLGDPHRGFQRLGAVIAFADLGAALLDGGIDETGQLPAGQTGDPRNIERVVFGHGHGAKVLSHSKPSVQLHAPAVGDVHLWMAGGVGIALDHDRVDPVVLQLERQCEPDRAPAGNQDRSLFGGRRLRIGVSSH